MEEIKLNEEQSWYEVDIDGKLAALTHFTQNGNISIFDHTETEPAYEGQGLAAKVVQFALDDVRAKGGKIWPLCPFVLSWLRKHPDYSDLVA
ncbi:MAG: N-acetyltransferase [Propionibacteriaceae bacterium]|jgi:predicted GNAT family acetyltransferase|nr:N-acetyltransferase [Propionibacteriaceae bacterium]